MLFPASRQAIDRVGQKNQTGLSPDVFIGMSLELFAWKTVSSSPAYRGKHLLLVRLQTALEESILTLLVTLWNYLLDKDLEGIFRLF